MSCGSYDGHIVLQSLLLIWYGSVVWTSKGNNIFIGTARFRLHVVCGSSANLATTQRMVSLSMMKAKYFNPVYLQGSVMIACFE